MWKTAEKANLLKSYILDRFNMPPREGPAACFHQLAEHLCSYLVRAQQNIQVAVCWFTHRDIFEVLLKRLRAGVQVELLLEYDTQNIRLGGLDFQLFIQQGGQLFACTDAGLMHHKFAIIDHRLLLTGSYNWTYNSNAENLLVLHDPALVQAFHDEFLRLKSTTKRIFRVRLADAKVFAAFPLFENTKFPLADLRKKVGGGAGVWVVRLDRLKVDYEIIFKQQSVPFDASALLAPFWTAYRRWDETLFDAEMERLNSMPVSGKTLRDVRCWARRIKTGDVVFTTEKQAQALVAIGIVQSNPQPYEGAGFSSFRAVQWLKILSDRSYALPEKISGQAVARYRGSAMRVLQEVMGAELKLPDQVFRLPILKG